MCRYSLIPVHYKPLLQMHYKLLKLVVMVTTITIWVLGKVNLSWAGPWNLSFQLGKIRTIDPKKTCHYCKDTGHNLDNCLCLQHKKDFLA